MSQRVSGLTQPRLKRRRPFRGSRKGRAMRKIARFNSEPQTGIDQVLKPFSIAIMLVIGAWLGTGALPAQAAPCLIVTLTGTTGGPPVINGLTGAGTLVRYGNDANNCGAVNLQFDSGR